MIESAHNLGVLTQALGRVRRLGNPSEVVYLYEYYVESTFDDLSVWRNIEKFISEAMATLNLAIFIGGDESTGELDVGDWTIQNGELIKCEDTMEDGEIVEPFSAQERRSHSRYIYSVVKRFFNQQCGLDAFDISFPFSFPHLSPILISQRGSFEKVL